MAVFDFNDVVSPLPSRDVEDDEQKFAIPTGHMTWSGALYRMVVDERPPGPSSSTVFTDGVSRWTLEKIKQLLGFADSPRVSLHQV